MRRVLGSVLVLVGCLMPTLELLHQQRTHLHLLEEAAGSLDDLRRMLMRNAPTMAALLEGQAASCSGRLEAFYRSIRLDRLEEHSFRAQWQRGTELLFSQEEERAIWNTAGQILGQCEIEEQCSSLKLASEQLKSLLFREREGFARQKKLSVTLSVCIGALTAILLL